MSRTVLLAQIDSLPLNSVVRKRLEALAAYKAIDGYQIVFSLMMSLDITREFTVTIMAEPSTREGGGSFTIEQFPLKEVPEVASFLAMRGDLSELFNEIRARCERTIDRAYETLIEPYVNPLEAALRELDKYDTVEVGWEFDDLGDDLDFDFDDEEPQ